MRNLVPHFIQEHTLRGEHRGKFSAISLFLDISGFSAITEALMAHGPHGAEVLASMMRQAFDPLAKSVFAQGGFIATMAGDAFMALFPWDRDEAEAARRALAASWGAQRHMTSKSEWQTPYGSFSIQAKIGLATGEVHWGIVTSRDGRKAAYYFKGTAVDGCARAEHFAKAGDIVLDETLAHLVAGGVQLQHVEDHYSLLQIVGSLPQPRPFQLPPSDPAITSRFFPEILLSQAYSGEFRQVINLFISLPTVRTESQLDIFMHSLFELLERYGGLLKTLDFGDKGSTLLLVWGAPIAYENDIERALDFILALQPLTSIPINAGITYQISHAGFIGSPLMEEYTCFGRGVNLAARLMVAAPRGEIWVDAHIASRVQRRYVLEPVGEMDFKGFATAQMVYTLLERKEESEPFFTSPLVGREIELGALVDFVAPLWEGSYAGALVITGEPGIGKSRLADGFKEALLLDSKPMLWAICQTDGTLRASLNPFAYWLRRYFTQSSAFIESRNKRSFNLRIDELIEATAPKDRTEAEELDRTRSCLGALLGLHWSDSLYEQLDPQGRYENTLIAITTLLRAEALRQPVILLLEDVQWLDDDTRAYLPRLARALTSDENQSYPIAILATSRLESHNDLLGHGLDFQVVDLMGITGDKLADLAEQILDGSPTRELLELVEARTEGNPFFAEQVLHYLKEEGRLQHNPEGWVMPATNDPEPLPVDVRAVLAARLDRLGQDVKDVVQTASILGREFEAKLLARMHSNDAGLFQKMELASKASIWTALTESRYLFNHALVHDTAYRMLVHAHRRSLHGLAVKAIESLYTPELRVHFGELAYHSEMAGLVDKARRYLSLAGNAARDVYLNSQALDYYSRALRLTPANDLTQRYNLLLKREGILDLLGDREAQLIDLETLQELAAAMDDQAVSNHLAEIGERRANYAYQIGDYKEAIAEAVRAVSLARAASNTEIAVRAHLTWAFTLLRQAKYSHAIHHAEEGLELARQMGNLGEQARALNMLGLIAIDQKGYTKAYQYLEAALRIAQEAGNRKIEAAALNNMGNLAGTSGDYIETMSYYQRALQVDREIGQRPSEGMQLGNLGWVTGILGDYATARSYCEQNLRIARETGHRQSEAYVLINLSAVSGCQADFAAAQSYAERSRIIAHETGDPSCEAWALTYLGHARLGLGEVESSLAAYAHALKTRRDLEQPNLAMEPLAGLARCELAREDVTAALRHVEGIFTHLDGGGNLDGTDEPMRVYLTVYDVLHSARDPRAMKVLREAWDILQERASKIKDAALRLTFLEKVPYHKGIQAAWESLSG